MPRITPMVAAIETAETETVSDLRIPSSERENISRPNSSVPNQKFELGPCIANSTFCSSGSCGIQPKTAHIETRTIKRSKTAPTTPLVLCK